MRPTTKTYYFTKKTPNGTYNHLSTNGEIILDFVIGEFLANCFCNDNNDLRVVIFRKSNSECNVRKRINDIILTITEYEKCE